MMAMIDVQDVSKEFTLHLHGGAQFSGTRKHIHDSQGRDMRCS